MIMNYFRCRANKVMILHLFVPSELSYRPSSRSISSLSLSLFHTNFTRLQPPFYLFSPLEPILCQHVLIKKKYACKAINILYV